MTTTFITVKDLVEVLKGQKKGTFSNFHIETVPTMNKTDNPYFGKVTKVTKGNILLGCSYKTRVINETNDVDFVPETNKVGGHVGDGLCILYNENKDRYYLQYEWFEEVTPKSEYFFEGNPIEKRMFESFMGTYTPNPKGVNVLSVGVNNIKEITLNKVRYITTERMTENPKPKVKKTKRVTEDMGMMEQ